MAWLLLFFLPLAWQWLLLVLFVVVMGCCWFMDELYPRLLLGSTVENFKSEMKNLVLSRNSVLKKVKAKNETEKVNDDVSKWLNDVEKLMEEAEELMKIENETDSSSFSIQEKYWMYDEIQSKAKALNTKYEIELFPISILTREYPSRNIEWFKSTKDASELLCEALYDDSSYIVGLHGMRGSGKTKLVKVVGDEASLLFYYVVFATVSQNSNIKIQGEIAEWLNLKLEENSEDVRARRIFLELRSKEPILVILDDVRAKLELEDIGIPHCSERCKVLLTTRSLQVCDLMECHKVITLNPLSDEEAWMWFKKHAGIDDESPSNILNLAREIAVECKGIPQTIKEVGSSLKRKPFEEWKASLDTLRHSAVLYQIFLSFRGIDTRYFFTGSLYHALCREGFKTFMDKEGLQSGDRISQSLIEAIQASRLSIVVFSENFAYSSWCLDELVTILECMKTRNQLVWPIFYKVEPSDVRYQKNSYGKAMDVHKNRFGVDSDKVLKWKSALFEVTNLSGDHFKTGIRTRRKITAMEA